MSLEANAETRDGSTVKEYRGLPGGHRRQAKRKGYSYPVMSALDAETFKAVDAHTQARGVTRSWVIADILREWARSQSHPAAPAGDPSEQAA
jgi:hypothetical protein